MRFGSTAGEHSDGWPASMAIGIASVSTIQAVAEGRIGLDSLVARNRGRIRAAQLDRMDTCTPEAISELGRGRRQNGTTVGSIMKA